MTKRPEHLGYADFDDLPETAKKIVSAALHLLATKGWSAFTIPAIAGEAGVYAPAINYYFGSKSGLVAMIYDSFMRETIEATRDSLDELESAEERMLVFAKAILDHPGIIGRNTDVAYHETLPHLVHDRQLRERTLERYEAWENIAAHALQGANGELDEASAKAYAVLLLAVIDGLSIRQLLEPENPAVDDVLRRFTRLLQERLDRDE